MSKLVTAGVATANSKSAKAPRKGETDKFDMNVEVTANQVTIGGKLTVPTDRLREVRFDRKDRHRFKVIVQILNEGSGVFTPYAGVSNNVVGLIDESELPEFKRRLENLHIRTLHLSV